MSPICTILILTYRGEYHLQYLLPSVELMIKNTVNYTTETWIVDNAASSDTRHYVNKYFPSFRYLPSSDNDYLFSLNHFVQQVNSPYVFILNDDMKIDENTLNHILPVIQADSGLFAVNCRLRDWDDTYNANSVRILSISKGWASNTWSLDENEGVRYTLYGGGGSAIFRTDLYNQIGGFDNIYRPAYGEDVDLSHKAWRMGYKTVFHPDAIIYHREGGTIQDQFKKNRIIQQLQRNRQIWMLTNIFEPGFLLWYFLKLPYRLIVWLVTDKNTLIAFLTMLPKAGQVLRNRLKNKENRVYSEKQIISYLDRIYQKED